MVWKLRFDNVGAGGAGGARAKGYNPIKSVTVTTVRIAGYVK